MIITLKREDVLPSQSSEHWIPLSYQMDPKADSLCSIDNIIYLRHTFEGKDQMFYLGYVESELTALSIIEETRIFIDTYDETELEVCYDEGDPQEDFIRFVELIERRAKG